MTNKTEKLEFPLPFFLFFFSFFFFFLFCETISIRTHSVERRSVTEPEKYTVCKPVSARFSPEIVSAGALEGLNQSSID